MGVLWRKRQDVFFQKQILDMCTSKRYFYSSTGTLKRRMKLFWKRLKDMRAREELLDAKTFSLLISNTTNTSFVKS